MCERYALISRYPAAQAKTPRGTLVLHGVSVMENYLSRGPCRLLHAMTRGNLAAVRKKPNAGGSGVGRKLESKDCCKTGLQVRNGNRTIF